MIGTGGGARAVMEQGQCEECQALGEPYAFKGIMAVPQEAKKLGAALTLRIFDGEITAEASREMKSPHYD